MTKSTNFNYYEADNVYGALFFQFPKVLMYGEQYKHLSSDAKLAYMVLKDRLEYSLRNNWVDEEGHVYFTFTNQELENLFNCHNQKVVKIKKELETAHLLMQKQLGFNPKTKKNEPNRLYLSKLDVKATDVYLRGEDSPKVSQTLDTSGNVKITLPQETAQTLDTSGNVKITLPHKSADETAQTLDTSGNVKITHNLYKDFKNIDTNRYDIDTQKLDFSTANFSPAEIEAQNRDLVKHADEFLTDEDNGLPVCLNAKYAVEKEHKDLGVWILLDDPDLKKMMTKTLRRYFNALRSDEKHIKNVENYLYGTMQNLFGVWWNQQAAKDYAAKHPEEEKSADNDNSGLYY
ncbi:replication initiator protein A [Lactobacillus paragasseri]|uniref:replication initiator protein A n=1 Tax=Lactobacillus paragasseri TaxID=2107999 RepID=UPI00254ACA80|nr:replication initiator protein A [Lactobacillus paragasseri]MDK8093898.1 replication initiator protein A [Lactobacillus paragasseri]MDK8607489.1 replication initiator protein A [Lactobacillus paragasseri]